MHPGGTLATKSRPARLIDIAGDVGVHPSVVSRTLSKDPTLNIREETRALILETAQRMGYRGNSAARILKGGVVGAIAVVMPSLRNPVWAEIIRGALGAAELEKMALLLAEVPDGSSDDESYVRLVEEGRIDGLLIGSSEPIAKFGEWPPSGVPTVHVNRAVRDAECNVVLDEEKAILLPLEHLAALGHRQISIIDGPAAIDTVMRRSASVPLIANRLGLDVRIFNQEFDESGGYRGMKSVLSLSDERPSAVIVASLTQVFGAMAAIRQSPFSVPEDVSVMSLDDDPLLDYLDVGVTSVHMPLYELGKAAAEALIGRIRGNQNPSAQISEPMYVVDRASTRPNA
jgi:LacI family transcriptional regulator